jgi:hypothetical protein
MLERGELASLHQDIPAQGLDACQTGLRVASPAALGVAVIVRTRGHWRRIGQQRRRPS